MRSGSGWPIGVDDTRDLLLALSVLSSATPLFAGDITLLPDDPRLSNPDLIDRDWGARLRNFGTTGEGSEIYVGAGDLSFAGNRKVADMLWANTPVGTNTFTFAFSPSPARFTVTAAGRTTASQFYDFQTPIANPNQPFNALLIHLENERPRRSRHHEPRAHHHGGSHDESGDDSGHRGAEHVRADQRSRRRPHLGIHPDRQHRVSRRLRRLPGGKPGIEFFALFDRSEAVQADLTLAKSHTGDFIQGQIGATVHADGDQYRPGEPQPARSRSWTTSLRR